MVVSENEVQKQIENMTALIDQEANEKVEEIEAKTEEEFQIEKSKIVEEQRSNIMEYYGKKENQIKMAKHIQNSNKMNIAKLKILSAKQDHIRDLLQLSKDKLVLISKDANVYQQTLKQLITQSLIQLLEKDVIIRCQKKDIYLVNLVLLEAVQDYSKLTGRTVNAVLDKNIHLIDIIGGVEVVTPDGRLRVVNTLDSRLELISEQMVPEIRQLMFGGNTNRKFND